MFCNNRKAQVVCYIDFVKVKAGVSKSVTVSTKKVKPRTYASYLYDSKYCMPHYNSCTFSVQITL